MSHRERSSRPQPSAAPARIDQAAFLQDRLQRGLTPEQVAGLTSLLVQMEEQRRDPETTIVVNVSQRERIRSLTFAQGRWQGQDLTANITDPAGMAVYGHGGRPYEQLTMVQMTPANAAPLLPPPPPDLTPAVRTTSTSFMPTPPLPTITPSDHRQSQSHHSSEGRGAHSHGSRDSSVLSSERQRSGQQSTACVLYTSPSPRDLSTSRMPSSA